MVAFLLVLLKVLQIIGIILLSVLSFALLLILLILFVPIKYRFSGEYTDENYSVNAKVTWLLHFISVSFEIAKEKDFKMLIKILGITLNDEKKEKKKKRKKLKKDNQKKKDKDTEENSDIPDNATESQDNKADSNSEIIKCDDVMQEETSEDIECQETEDNIDSNENVTSSDENQETKKKKKTEKDLNKESKYDKIKSYFDTIKSDEFKKAFELCKNSIIKIVKIMLPRKFKAVLNLSFSDPEKYGKAMAVYGMFFAVLYKNVVFNCVAGDDYIDVSANGKGHIRMITLLVIAIRVFFDKNVRKLLKMFKEE